MYLYTRRRVTCKFVYVRIYLSIHIYHQSPVNPDRTRALCKQEEHEEMDRQIDRSQDPSPHRLRARNEEVGRIG